MFQGAGQHMSAVGSKMKTKLPQQVAAKLRNDQGRYGALSQGSVGPTMSDLQEMQNNERKQHEQNYIYEHGHNDGSAPLGKPSF
jgi:hypothetical protein